MNPYEMAAAAAQVIAGRTGRPRHDLAVVLGSGLGAFAEGLEEARAIPMAELPGFAVPSVAGHAGSVVSAQVAGRAVLVLAGRVHLYEGHSVGQVCHGVRTAAACGISTVVLTNAAGSLRPELEVGSLVAISDHLNLTGANPLAGPLAGGERSPFCDMSAAYSPRLRGLAAALVPGLGSGVYAAMAGPSYETPAEVRMLGLLGADLVGMSTVCEAIAAAHLGLETAAFSLVTNAAAGLGGALSHAEVTSVGAGAAADTVEFLGRFCRAVLAGLS